jgi:RNA-binding protein Musashi|tara:strand:+ start:136 stop:387 length:252 start_codon:yes stop_codon:yes gene_type:complete
MNSGYNDPSNTSVGQSPRGDQTKASYGFGKDLANSQHEQAGNAPPAHGWTEHTAPEGYVYYYNSKSGVSQWERPMELDFPLSN